MNNPTLKQMKFTNKKEVNLHNFSLMPKIIKFAILLISIFVCIFTLVDSRRHWFRRSFTRNFVEINKPNNRRHIGNYQRRFEREVPDANATLRPSHHDVYLWPSINEHEKQVIRSAFEQIHRRTCIRFNEMEYKPWYHAERWAEGKPYIVIRKSKKFSGYSDNNIENVNRRSLIYLSEKALNLEPNNNGSRNVSRGLVMDQLLKFMGYREEFLRPDASSYIQPISGNKRPPTPSSSQSFSREQLMWPFDPESITVPASARDWFKLTIYCKGRQNSDIGAAQRAGILTRWDMVKLNAMYCPDQVGNPDPRMGPCVVPRKPRNSER